MRASDLPVRAALLLAAGVALATVAVLGALWATGAPASQETRQEEIAEKGARVMPFDLEETTHVFEKTRTGGVQEVVADDPNDAEQVALIREHLEEEAAAFRRGDLSDPSQIHGEEMPGLEELEEGAEEIDIRYSELPDGAKIEYEASDPALVAALHDWFDAQVSDHGGQAEDGASGADGRPSDQEGHDDEQHSMEH
ncbi:MAG: aspartate carbamoyltransferase [Actinomycetota bacterium]|nr:aspartate carbamoyltransferase [Actinomycetota bacterium]